MSGQAADRPELEVVKPEVVGPEAEAKGVDVLNFEHRGLKFKLPASVDDWPYEATLRFEEGHGARFFAALLSDAELKALLALRPRVTNKEWGELFLRIAVEYGFESPGE